MDNNWIIETQDLTKKYDDLVAVDHVNLNVKKGEIFGYLGPNGAGKTTTIKMILDLRPPTKGNILIDGKSLNKHSVDLRDKIGYLPEKVAFYENITPVETLNFFCELKGKKNTNVDSLLREVGLEKVADRKVGKFSKGMTQLLGIAQAMIGNPPIYIFDEPMGGLDPKWVRVVREKIKHLNDEGATILFSSHILKEVQEICDRVAILNNGKLVAQDTPDKLSEELQLKPKLEIEISDLNGNVAEPLTAITGVYDAYVNGNKLMVTSEPEARIDVLKELIKSDVKINNFETIETPLEDVFMKITKEGDIS